MDEGRRYRILGILGQGGFGTVYRAEMLGEGGFSRAVALKVLNPDVQGVAEIGKRLRDEAKLLGLIRHRAILAVDSLVQLDDRWTIVMEYVEGRNIEELVAAVAIPVSCALEIIEEVAAALHVAYSSKGPEGTPLNLLHRDIKPPNIMVTAAGEVKVLDFGIARADFADREAATKSMMFGSPGYMAPERFEFDEQPAGDIYSLGVVLYEMLSRESFGQTTVNPRKFVGRMDEAAGKLEAVDAPAEVIALIRHMMSYEVDDRPTAREVERRCRDLRAETGSPWLRDWAEQALPEMPGRELKQHDFSRDVVTESRTGSSTVGFGVEWTDESIKPEPPPPPPQPTDMPAGALETFNPDDPASAAVAKAAAESKPADKPAKKPAAKAKEKAPAEKGKNKKKGAGTSHIATYSIAGVGLSTIIVFFLIMFSMSCCVMCLAVDA